MRILIFSFIISNLFSVSCFADTLELENGDRITGKIVQMNEDTVTVKAEYGVLVIKRAYIKKGLFAPQAAIPRQGLVIELLFAGALTDTSANKSKLISNGITFVEGRDGTAGSAIAADGTGQYASMTQTQAIDSLDSFSVSFWFIVKNGTKSQYLVSKWDSTTGSQADGKFAVLYKAGYISCYAADNAGTYYTVKSEETAEANSWCHIAFVCDKGSLTLSLNGKKAGEKKYGFGAARKNESPLYLLTAKAVNDPKMAYYDTEGAIDNLRIYDRPLTDKEIVSLFTEFSGE